MQVVILHDLFQPQEFLLLKRCTVHFPSPIHQIMCLVNQENIVFPHSFGKKTLQIDMWIKQIVIITDDHIRKQTHIQTHFKRTHLMACCIFFDLFTGKVIFMDQQIIDRIVNPVKMSLGIGTVYGIALGFFHKTDFVLSSQCNRLQT